MSAQNFKPPRKSGTPGALSFLCLLLSIPGFFIWSVQAAVVVAVRVIFGGLLLASLGLSVVAIHKRDGVELGVASLVILALIFIVLASSVMA